MLFISHEIHIRFAYQPNYWNCWFGPAVFFTLFTVVITDQQNLNASVEMNGMFLTATSNKTRN